MNVQHDNRRTDRHAWERLAAAALRRAEWGGWVTERQGRKVVQVKACPCCLAPEHRGVHLGDCPLYLALSTLPAEAAD